MRKIIVFNLISLDGYFAGPKGELDWHNVDDEFNQFAVEHTKEFGTLIFGRVTYELMASFWPQAVHDPKMTKEDLEIAKIMNTVPKIVFSKTIKKVEEKENWKNVTLFREIVPEEIKKLKQQSGRDIAIFGSGTIDYRFQFLYTDLRRYYMQNVVVPINYVAVLVAAIASMVIGFLWYGPLFGKAWMKEMGMSKEKMTAAMKKSMGKSYALMLVGSLVMAYVLAHALIFAGAYLKLTGILAGLMSGFWNWLGFIAPVTLGAVLWEGKSWKLWFLNNGYYLVTLLAMGTVLAVWR